MPSRSRRRRPAFASQNDGTRSRGLPRAAPAYTPRHPPMTQDILLPLSLEGLNSGVFADDWVESPAGGAITSMDPSTARPIADVLAAGPAEYDQVVVAATRAFERWRTVPAPRRGEVVRQVAEVLRAKKRALGALVSLETGKILAEGEGEVQEMIDVADFAVGLSRQLYGKTMPSERPH